MDLLKPLKIAKKVVSNVMDTVKDKIEEAQQDVEAADKLEDWKKKLSTAISQYDTKIMDEREYLYLGTRSVDANINSNQIPSKYANNVNNIVFEFIETAVDTTIPQPGVKSKRHEYAHLASMIEDSIASDLSEMGIEEINDYNERITPVQGFSIMELCWDPDYKHRLYRGEMKLFARHPKQLIPQPGVFKLQKMDYFFIISSVTKEYIKKRYGVELDSRETEQYTDNTSLGSNPLQSINPNNEKVDEIVCWYKDDDGDISRFAWTNETVLEDLPKYFYRRLERCVKCDTIKTTDICQECGSTRFRTSIEKEMPLMMDTQIGTGEVLPMGTLVPTFCPTRYPVIIRKNVPKNFAFEGQSDVDIIRDQQDSIKKAITKAEEKIVKGGSIVLVDEKMNIQLTDENYQIVRGNAQQLASIKVENLQADINQEMAWAESQYKIAQSMLGITDAFQGKEDPTAKSGVAKQIQVQQASGRLQSKQFNKQDAFKELFEIMFEFKLAFYDEVRPYLAKDKEGKDMFQSFDKYAFLIRDADGQLYYNTDFIFSADAGQGLPKDKIFLFNQAKEMLSSGAIDQLQYWTIMEGLNFPMAKQIKTQIEERMQMEQQNNAMSIVQLFNSMPPEQREMFFSATPDMQAQFMQQLMGNNQRKPA